MLVLTLATLLFAAGVHADTGDAQLCQDSYVQAEATDPSNTCDHLREFSQCTRAALSDVPALQSQRYLQFVADKQETHADRCMHEFRPRVAFDHGAMTLSAEEGIRFARTASNPSSLFDFVAEYNALLDSTAAASDVSAFVSQASGRIDAIESQALMTAGAISSTVAEQQSALESVALLVDTADNLVAAERTDREAMAARVRGAVSAAVSEINAELAAVANEVYSAVTTLQSSVADSVVDLEAELAGITTLAERAEAESADVLADAVSELEAALEQLEDDLATQPPVIWSGGCRYSSYGGGWDTYCYSGNDIAGLFPPALYSDYIEVHSGNRFRFKQPGYYRLNWWAIQHGCGSYDVWWESTWNGGHRRLGYAHRNSKPGGWFSNFMDQTWAFKEGDQFWMRVHGGWCGPWRWHSWNDHGNHSRMQVRYLGPLSDGS